MPSYSKDYIIGLFKLSAQVPALLKETLSDEVAAVINASPVEPVCKTEWTEVERQVSMRAFIVFSHPSIVVDS